MKRAPTVSHQFHLQPQEQSMCNVSMRDSSEKVSIHGQFFISFKLVATCRPDGSIIPTKRPKITSSRSISGDKQLHRTNYTRSLIPPKQKTQAGTSETQNKFHSKNCNVCYREPIVFHTPAATGLQEFKKHATAHQMRNGFRKLLVQRDKPPQAHTARCRLLHTLQTIRHKRNEEKFSAEG